MELVVNNEELKEPVKKVVKELHLVPENSLKGVTWGINEFRYFCCKNRSASWVRTFIFDQFPETDFKNGGWCVAPHKTPGIKGTSINAYEAKQWMAKHWHEINWYGTL